MKSPSCESENDVEILRRHILSCPYLTQDSQAITLALTALDKVHRQTHTHSLSSKSTKRRRGASLVNLIRILLIDLPLAALFASYVLLVLIHKIRDELIHPQLELMEWNQSRRSEELTYYHRSCDQNDLTTLDVADLIIGDNFTVQDCVHHQMIHGMSIYPGILKDNTSDILRQYILERNAQLTPKDAIGVLSNQNRWSFGIDVHDHPIIPVALKEISSHPIFRPAVEKIVGPNPAVIEFTAITSAYGAEDQIWHTDVLSTGSAARYAKSFIPSYSFFISLQDITAKMGATTVCPGTYMCDSQEVGFCEDHCFQASGDSVWKKGYGILMNQQSFHRGAAHIEPDGPHRVLFIVTFTHRPAARAETRQIGQGGSYSMKWDNWGHTMTDLSDSLQTITPPWSYLRALGIYKPFYRDWGWDYISMVSMRVANRDTGYTLANLKEFGEKNPLELPSFLLPTSVAEGMTWSEYGLSILISIQHFLFNLNCFVLSFYAFILLGIGVAIIQVYEEVGRTTTTLHSFKQTGLFLFNPLRRLVVSHGSIILLFFLIWKKIDSSNWALDIRKKHLYTSAFSKQEIPPFLIDRPTIHVHRDDLIVSTRAISQHFASYDMFMDYHPGNQALRDDLDSLQFPFPMLDQFIESFVDTLLAKGHFFLIQNSNGDWVEMSSDERKWYILREILLKSNTVWNKIDQEANLLLSQSYYSSILSRTMAFHTRDAIYLLLRLIPTDIGQTLLDMNKFYNIQNTQRDVFDRNFQTHKRQQSLSSNQSHWRRRVTLKPLLQYVEQNKKKPSFHNDISRFRVGDIVDACYRGKGIEWYRGTITRIVGGGLFNVRYDDGDFDNALPLKAIEPFHMYEVNEAVQGNVRVNNNERRWYSAKILDLNKENDSATLVFDDDGDVIELAFRYIRRLR